MTSDVILEGFFPKMNQSMKNREGRERDLISTSHERQKSDVIDVVGH